eukprot:6144700-Prymnesium_polylepis.2
MDMHSTDSNRSRAAVRQLYSFEHRLLPALRSSHRVVVVESFLSDREIAAVHAIAEPVTRREPWNLELGRDKSTGYSQYVHRVEQELHDGRRDLFDRIVGASWALDERYWNKFPLPNKGCRPQMEYIDYDIDRLGKKGTFETHVDNYAAVTSIILLTRPGEDFRGGLNYFFVNGTKRLCDGAWDASERLMEVPLQRGDAVFFRGEVVPHGIGEVRRGRRVVLQTEMS